MSAALVPLEARRQLAQAAALAQALEQASEPEEIRNIETKLDAVEHYMKSAGFYCIEEIRPVHEARMRARWKLGKALAKQERGAGPGRGKGVNPVNTFFRGLLKRLGITPPVAMQAQRLGTLPAADLNRAFDEARKKDRLLSFDELLQRAKPFWYKEQRNERHKNIAAKAAKVTNGSGQYQFGLLYADPPWVFETHSPKGAESRLMPDQHYPTLSDEEICSFTIDGKRIDEIAGKDAALFLWCTSSNMERALRVLRAWGFIYKTHAICDKEFDGTGFIFRNRHELLMYADRGNIPRPVETYSSVFRYKRTTHSAKPPEIRKAIEEMYPHFDANTRAELFSRGEHAGWSCFGFEAGSDEAIEVERPAERRRLLSPPRPRSLA
jgi:N6-adenosine-specific RNA methylase IME4